MATTQVNGKTGNSTPCHPEPLNRSSQKVAHVITSSISPGIQNFVTIPQGVSFPSMREIAHQNVYSASFFRVLQGRIQKFSKGGDGERGSASV